MDPSSGDFQLVLAKSSKCEHSASPSAVYNYLSLSYPSQASIHQIEQLHNISFPISYGKWFYETLLNPNERYMCQMLTLTTTNVHHSTSSPRNDQDNDAFSYIISLPYLGEVRLHNSWFAPLTFHNISQEEQHYVTQNIPHCASYATDFASIHHPDYQQAPIPSPIPVPITFSSVTTTTTQVTSPLISTGLPSRENVSSQQNNQQLGVHDDILDTVIASSIANTSITQHNHVIEEEHSSDFSSDKANEDNSPKRTPRVTPKQNNVEDIQSQSISLLTIPSLTNNTITSQQEQQPQQQQQEPTLAGEDRQLSRPALLYNISTSSYQLIPPHSEHHNPINNTSPTILVTTPMTTVMTTTPTADTSLSQEVSLPSSSPNTLYENKIPGQHCPSSFLMTSSPHSSLTQHDQQPTLAFPSTLSTPNAATPTHPSSLSGLISASSPFLLPTFPTVFFSRGLASINPLTGDTPQGPHVPPSGTAGGVDGGVTSTSYYPSTFSSQLQPLIIPPLPEHQHQQQQSPPPTMHTEDQTTPTTTAVNTVGRYHNSSSSPLSIRASHPFAFWSHQLVGAFVLRPENEPLLSILATTYHSSCTFARWAWSLWLNSTSSTTTATTTETSLPELQHVLSPNEPDSSTLTPSQATPPELPHLLADHLTQQLQHTTTAPSPLHASSLSSLCSPPIFVPPPTPPFSYPARPSRAAYLCTLAVPPQFFGSSLGSLLLFAAIESAITHYNAWYIYLHVLTSNKRAIGLYKRFGFVVEGFLPAMHPSLISPPLPDDNVVNDEHTDDAVVPTNDSAPKSTEPSNNNSDQQQPDVSTDSHNSPDTTPLSTISAHQSNTKHTDQPTTSSQSSSLRPPRILVPSDAFGLSYRFKSVFQPAHLSPSGQSRQPVVDQQYRPLLAEYSSQNGIETIPIAPLPTTTRNLLPATAEHSSDMIMGQHTLASLPRMGVDSDSSLSGSGDNSHPSLLCANQNNSSAAQYIPSSDGVPLMFGSENSSGCHFKPPVLASESSECIIAPHASSSPSPSYIVPHSASPETGTAGAGGAAASSPTTAHTTPPCNSTNTFLHIASQRYTCPPGETGDAFYMKLDLTAWRNVHREKIITLLRTRIQLENAPY